MPTDQLARQRAKTAGTRIPPTAPRPSPALPDLQRRTDKVKATPDLRREKVEALRNALAADQYDLDARLHELIDRTPEEWQTLASAP